MPADRAIAAPRAGLRYSATMKNGSIVIAGCLLLSVVLGAVLYSRYRTTLPAVQDVVTGLIYFIEEHEGRFPASQEEFLSAGIFEKGADGAWRIVPRPNSHYQHNPHRAPIASFEPFKIAWGADLSTWTVAERGVVHDGSGEGVLPVTWPSSPKSGEGYARILLRVHAETRARLAASQPAG